MEGGGGWEAGGQLRATASAQGRDVIMVVVEVGPGRDAKRPDGKNMAPGRSMVPFGATTVGKAQLA